jgi:uncharacterized NAD(P)/FAD-binding protein YdhS
VPLLRTIAIVGGGFSGVSVVINLLRRPPTGPTRIVLIERSASIGRGVAYAKRSFSYLLNVPASRMSANPAAPEEFLEFARRRIPRASGEDFLPRSLYGDYLEEALLAAQLSSPRHVRFETWRGEVEGLRRVERDAPLRVELGDGRDLTADHVVLATGNPPPAPIRAAQSVVGHPRYIGNPWAQDLQFAREEKVLLIGTGLTAADVVSAASADERTTPSLHALSRHGLVPPRQTPFRPDAFRGDGNALLAAATSLRGLTRSVRLLATEAEDCGGDWREAITFVRNMAPTIWRRLPERDRLRFLRHLRALWDAHRHRLPAEVLRRIDALKAQGRLHVHAGRIEEINPHGDRLEVRWRPRGVGGSCTHVFDRVVNCTGPDYAIASSGEALWRNLVQCRLAAPDSLGLGLRTGPNGAVVDADAWPGPHLFYVGPMLRADHWEATAVGELRVHAQRVATLLAHER